MKSTKSKHDIEDNSRNLNLSNKQNNSREKEKKNDKPPKRQEINLNVKYINSEKLIHRKRKVRGGQQPIHKDVYNMPINFIKEKANILSNLFCFEF